MTPAKVPSSDTGSRRGFGFGLLVGALGCLGGILLAAALSFGLRSAVGDVISWLFVFLPPLGGLGVACWCWPSRQAFWGAIAGTLLIIFCALGVLVAFLSQLRVGM